MAINPMAATVEGRMAAFTTWRRRSPWLGGEVLSSGLSLLLSTYFLYESVRLGLTNGAQAAPGTFPALISAGLVICSALWLWGVVRKMLAPGSADDDVFVVEDQSGQELPASAPSDVITSETANWRVLFVVCWSALLLPLTESIGMVPMLFIYLAGLYWIVARVPIWKTAIVLVLVLALFSWGAYEGRIYLPDPLRIGRTIHELITGLLGT